MRISGILLKCQSISSHSQFIKNVYAEMKISLVLLFLALKHIEQPVMDVFKSAVRHHKNHVFGTGDTSQMVDD